MQCDVLVCEELTQLEAQLWADIAKVSQMADVSFILCGDYEQFHAICEHWAGSSVPEGSLERSHMVQDLARNNRLALTENKRSDQVLFDFYTSLSSRPLAELLNEARILFPVHVTGCSDNISHLAYQETLPELQRESK